MSNEDKEPTKIVIALIVGVLALTLILSQYIYWNSQAKRQIIQNMVKAGADPIAAHCAAYGFIESSRAAICSRAGK